MQENDQNEDKEFAEEYRHIRKDLKMTIAINLVFLAILIALYFLNKQTGFIESLSVNL